MVLHLPTPITISKLPATEQQTACHVVFLLLELVDHVENFSAAVSLCDHAEAVLEPLWTSADAAYEGEGDRAAAWMGVALRDAAITLDECGIIIDAIVVGLRACPALLKSVTEARMKTFQPAFYKHFPQSRTMRNAVGHRADFIRSMEKFNQNAYKDPYGGQRIAKQIGRKLLLANEGRWVSVEATAEWHSRLEEVANNIFLASTDAANHLNE
jgi:hypothetical protein